MRILVRFTAVTLTLLSHQLSHAETTYACPDTVRIASGTVAADTVPPGYDAVVSKTPVRLSGINVFDGPPEDGAALVPHSERKATQKTATTSIWKFEGNYPLGKYISCDYGYGVVRVIARTYDSVTSCTAHSEIIKPSNIMKARFSCN